MNRSEILQDIRNRIGGNNLFEGNVLRRGKCSVNLIDVAENERVVVDFDSMFPAGREGENQCECVLFFFNRDARFVVVPMELKGGGNAEAAKAVKQLKAGVGFAADYTPKNVQISCYPILLHNGITKLEIRQLNKDKSKVTFKGNKFAIKIARCGVKLSDILPESTC